MVVAVTEPSTWNRNKEIHMKVRSGSVLLLTFALSWTVLAQTQSPMRPGSWQVTMKMNMPQGDMSMKLTGKRVGDCVQ